MLHTDDCDKFNNSNNVNESDSSSENDDYNFDITKKRKYNDESDDAFDGEKSELEALGIVSYQHSIYEEKFVHQIEKNVDEFAEKQHECSQEEEEEENITSIVDDDDDDDELPNTTDDGPSYVDDLNDYFDDDVDRFLEAPDDCNLEISHKKIEKIDKSKATENVQRNRILDDGDIMIYRKRIVAYENNNRLQSNEELYQINQDFFIPQRIWDRLFDYQHDAVKWMCDLHLKLCGGILGDEMGLGKTVEVIAFLVALSFSKSFEVSEYYKYLGPVLLVCPATVMYQWVNEFHKWWPPFRVAVLHQSGTYKDSNRSKLINDIIKTNGILITSYKTLVCFQKHLLPKNWHYVILDEGHKIRNPIAQVTQCCKLFETCHRLILSGTPIQNDLTELWSLMNFVFPNKLGTLDSFMNGLGMAIKKGGYSHASEQEIQNSFNCSVILRDLIKPYLLRRTKDEIKNNLSLPPKNEQVLFCKLTDIQKKYYQDYINSEAFARIDMQKASIFKALVNIRKICNHPYLFSKECSPDGKFDKEFFKMSSKMVVVNALLKLWHKQGQKVLIFTQGRQMLNLLERWVIKKKYDYFRMDGTTTINMRQNLIKSFNEDKTKFVFLLTTRVGGVGVSLTGANRVIIFDPDWNPCTDIQARERCWRIGQKRDVVIYRLMTSGTVEEKIYHRQIFKQYLSNRILRDPKHQKFVKMNNMRELFTLSDCSETGLYFYDSKVKLNRKKNQEKFKELQKQSASSSSKITEKSKDKKLPKIPKKNCDNSNKNNNSVETNATNLIDWSNVKIEISEERRQELREQVKKICQKQFETKSNSTNMNDESLSSQSQSSCTSSEVGCSSENFNSSSLSKNKSTDIQYVIDNRPNGVKVKILGEKKKQQQSKNVAKFEGHQIKYLVKKETYNETKDNVESAKMIKSNKNEDYILSKIFGRSVESILQHDRIEYNPIPDHSLIEKEAKDLAKHAIENLKQQITIQNQSSSSSTTTSTNNRLSNLIKPRLKPSSSSSSSNQEDLSTNSILKERANKFIGHNNNSKHLPLSDKFDEYKTLAMDIYQFLRNHNDRVCTDIIVEEFRPKIRNNQSAAFRELLINMAILESDIIVDEQNSRNVNKYWKLKDEFRLPST
ncbi:DNA excision repair protein ERCC-6 [Dermatophagoides pteronyssinus]|uniref:DNA repair and recombination protein RAD54-like n=1 Tax=Dermatophagoides pteronyssinus TaxID=6956 RepID=A0ABQ8JD31_DERPT|nr:DNA excision repair protein ERCC-6 [Dermatophagoides pteronyssinus]